MTKSEPANTKPTAASAAYAQRSADIARLIDTLRQELASHAKRAALAEKHWGYAGDLGSVREGLLDLVTAMSGIEREDVEEMLAEARLAHPELKQVVFRVGTVLGAGLENQITELFHRKRLIAVAGSDSPFVFIWTVDLARILLRAASEGPAGIYNVCGDGTLSVHDLARVLGKPAMALPAWLLKAALGVARPLGLSRYGPEQVRFLQYRPVLDNTALKTEFGYVPELTSAETFALWQKAAGL